MLLYGVRLTWISLLFPFAIIPLLIAGLALGLIVAVLRVVAVDVVAVIDEFLKLLMYLTPIVYTPKLAISGLSTFVEWNPLTYLVGFSRDVLLEGSFYETNSFLLWSVVSLVFFLLSFTFFQLLGPKVLERLISN